MATSRLALKPQPIPRFTSSKQCAILRSATLLFLRHGYSSTTMDAIARHARVTKQTVYAYYHDKNSLFVQMISDLCQKHTPSDALFRDKKRSFEELLFTMGKALLDLITSPEVLAATRLVIAESERHPKLAQLYYESGTLRLVGALAQFLQQQNTRGAIHIADTASAASYFISMLKGQYYLRMILRSKPVPSQQAKLTHIRECVQIFKRIYGSENPMLTRSSL